MLMIWYVLIKLVLVYFYIKIILQKHSGTHKFGNTNISIYTI